MPIFLYTGRSHYLTQDQEKRTVAYMLTMSKIGYGISRHELPQVVKSVLDKAEADGMVSREERKFKDNLPTIGWVYSFLKRHPELSLRTPENLGFQRAHISEKGIRKWFLELKNFLSEEHNLNAEEFLAEGNGERIYNIDESGFPLQGTAGKCKVITMRGSKNVHKLTSDNKQQISVLACVSAAGTFSKPFVLFPGKRLPKFNLESVDENQYDLGYSPNGWMSSDAFFGWMSNLFYPSIKNRVQFPIILFMDGHTSHINIAVSDFCKEHQIILYCFPAHASHVLQPLDVCVFGPLKKFWNKSIQDFYATHRVAMTKTHFFPVFNTAWKQSCGRPENAVSGFRSTGLVPFNAEQVDYSKLLDQSSIEKFKTFDSKNEISAGERVGLYRALAIVGKELDEDMRKDFDKRIEEGYDVEDMSEKGKLWRIYNNLKKSISYQEEIIENNNVIIAQSVNNEDERNDRSEEPFATTSTSTSCISHDIHENIPCGSSYSGGVGEPDPIESIVLEGEVLPDISENSIMNDSSSSYSHFEMSPFKTYLAINENVIINRKVTAKPKVPYAISGTDYNKTLKMNQNKKAEAEAQKIKRRNDRMAKRNQKQLKIKVKRVKAADSSTEEDTDILYDDSSSDNILEEELNVNRKEKCLACDGRDLWNRNNAWIGCNKCEGWIHRSCVSKDVENMSEIQIKEFDFVCFKCK